MTNQLICKLDDIIPDGGVCALFEGKQVAIFRTKNDELFAIDNFDPFSKANVLSRGLIGSTMNKIQREDGSIDKGETLYVASPIYKQRFDLATGQCLDDDSVKLSIFPVALEGDSVLISLKNEVPA